MRTARLALLGFLCLAGCSEFQTQMERPNDPSPMRQGFPGWPGVSGSFGKDPSDYPPWDPPRPTVP